MIRLIFTASLWVLASNIVIASGEGQDQAPSKSWWDSNVDTALDRTGERRGLWEHWLLVTADDQREATSFLFAHMMKRDLENLPPSQLRENIELALRARREVPWGKTIPHDVFLNDVLPYSHVNESRDPWRQNLYDVCMPLVSECTSPGEAAQTLNNEIFRHFKVKYSTKRRRPDQSSKETIETGVASCTGLSILLADACRAVCVPARLAGIANWIDKRGNHTWVEVWDQQWHFTGAAEASEHGLNHAWFQADAALAKRDVREHAIWAVSYAPTGESFPLVWAPGHDQISAVNVTDRYVHKDSVSESDSRLMIRVVDSKGVRVAATVQLWEQRTNQEEKPQEGVSKDESADTNDILSFDVVKGLVYSISVSLDGIKKEVEQTINQERTIVTIMLSDPCR